MYNVHTYSDERIFHFSAKLNIIFARNTDFICVKCRLQKLLYLLLDEESTYLLENKVYIKGATLL